ncbi:MAG: rod shape-determining protein RodA [Candidatus Levybacteria bacterium]|nr:rod shape-determining protein RodA [Candidatus Levybacteria bacterium]
MSKGWFFTVDWMLLIPALILVIFGLATLLSISASYFFGQLLYIVFSLFVFFVFSHAHYLVIKLYAVPIYLVALIALVLVLVLGFESRGAVRWFDIAGFRIQFSEVFKPFLIISLSSFLASGKNTSFSLFSFTLFLLFPIVLLVFLQPDLGSSLIYFFVVVATMLVFGFPLRWFVGFFFFLSPFLPIAWQFLHDYQRQRIFAFLSPGSDPLGLSYNAIQALIAVGSGLLFGKGLGQGTQSVLRFLPERHTDFIFATINESFGFVGGMIVLASFTFLLYRIFILSRLMDDTFRKLFCVGSFFLFLIQFFVNVGMNIGLTPVVGVTLPFVSYGGSSILSSFILLGLLSSFSFHIKQQEVLEIR